MTILQQHYLDPLRDDPQKVYELMLTDFLLPAAGLETKFRELSKDGEKSLSKCPGDV